jgi:hypothetical protein
VLSGTLTQPCHHSMHTPIDSAQHRRPLFDRSWPHVPYEPSAPQLTGVNTNGCPACRPPEKCVSLPGLSVTGPKPKQCFAQHPLHSPQQTDWHNSIRHVPYPSTAVEVKEVEPFFTPMPLVDAGTSSPLGVDHVFLPHNGMGQDGSCEENVCPDSFLGERGRVSRGAVQHEETGIVFCIGEPCGDPRTDGRASIGSPEASDHHNNPGATHGLGERLCAGSSPAKHVDKDLSPPADDSIDAHLQTAPEPPAPTLFSEPTKNPAVKYQKEPPTAAVNRAHPHHAAASLGTPAIQDPTDTTSEHNTVKCIDGANESLLPPHSVSNPSEFLSCRAKQIVSRLDRDIPDSPAATESVPMCTFPTLIPDESARLQDSIGDGLLQSKSRPMGPESKEEPGAHVRVALSSCTAMEADVAVPTVSQEIQDFSPTSCLGLSKATGAVPNVCQEGGDLGITSYQRVTEGTGMDPASLFCAPAHGAKANPDTDAELEGIQESSQNDWTDKGIAPCLERPAKATVTTFEPSLSRKQGQQIQHMPPIHVMSEANTGACRLLDNQPVLKPPKPLSVATRVVRRSTAALTLADVYSDVPEQM